MTGERRPVRTRRGSVGNVMGRGEPSGHLLGLNGGSSAGKTTLGRRLQSHLDGPWLLVGIDLLMWALPVEMVGDPGGIQILDGEIRRGADFLRVYAGFQGAVATLVSNGLDVILDDVLVDGIEDQHRWEDALGGLPVCWVAVRCDPETAAVREEVRGDRPSGIARRHADSVHRHVRYDIEVDTATLEPVEAATLITDALRDRWSITSTPSTEVVPGLPPTSAWNLETGRKAAPWER
jgi:chloramphenicol 3-O phosphotransferase